MRSSLIVGVALLLTIATTSIVQACKSEHTCGNLGPGTWIVCIAIPRTIKSLAAATLFHFCYFAHNFARNSYLLQVHARNSTTSIKRNLDESTFCIKLHSYESNV